jgi:hypothetical protein
MFGWKRKPKPKRKRASGAWMKPGGYSGGPKRVEDFGPPPKHWTK